MQDYLGIPILRETRGESMAEPAASKKGLDAGDMLGMLCFIFVLVVEFYGVYVLATVNPTTEKKELCPIFAMILSQVLALVVIPILVYGLFSMDNDWGDWLSLACAFTASWSAFIAGFVVISNKVNYECAGDMRVSLILFMVLDGCLGAWSTVGWLNKKRPW